MIFIKKFLIIIFNLIILKFILNICGQEIALFASNGCYSHDIMVKSLRKIILKILK